MILRTTTLTIVAGMLFMIVAGGISAFATANEIGKSSISDSNRSASANQFKPSQCSGLSLTNIVSGNGVVSGTSQNDLILGGPGIDIISGGGGNDCIVGGGGADTLIGGSGSDICVGGSGVDVLDLTCEGQYQ